MHHLFFLWLLILMVVACHPKAEFVIHGRMPDTSFDGEQIYLVPLFNATADRVDSCTIQQGKFNFRGIADLQEVFIIRPKPILRINVQELLVVKEPGEIQVEMGSNSFVSGTETNNSIQAWKKQKEMFDRQVYDLQVEKNNLPDSLQATIANQLDSLITARKNYHDHTSESNKDNAFGKMLIRMLNQAEQIQN
ncbi:DUF4369 domain-containing protein [Gaoshiqia sp. Z1-71]|uniref:DUF4369 domain-containing protein n=1 Tax=Gaoshiqia hydrogeniformans TaxID=3290090 RepID=UPI003BF888A9